MIDSDRRHMREILQTVVPSFYLSVEYLELGDKGDLPLGVLLAAFTRYTQRMVRENKVCEIDASIALIERLSGSKDPEVVNYVYTEVFDNLTGHGEEVLTLTRRFGPEARAAYADWILRNR